MNLIDILATLDGESVVRREDFLRSAGVDKALWKHIQGCFNKKNHLVNTDGRRLIVDLSTFSKD